ncbi:MAG: translation initiation factor IF-3 [Chloroflexota bacterium]|nr:translation initiation factor IF-3 [Chloroflexota bacterium]
MTIVKEARNNREIRAREVRVIDEDGEQIGILAIERALALAQEREVDLVEVSPNASPPVCRLMDYGKHKYRQTKEERSSRKNRAATTLKEVRFSPVMDRHDINYRVDRINKFLEEGHKVKAFVRFLRRQMSHPEHGHDVLRTVLEQLEDVAVVERRPIMEGNQLTTYLSPKPHAKRARGDGAATNSEAE